MSTQLRVLDAARSIVDEVNALLDARRPRLLYEDQLRESAESIASNIREAHGRHPGPDRNRFYRFARGSAEETDEHLFANYRAKRLSLKCYRRLHNRLATTIKMLNRLME
ncbi:MAG TPA: four helix bundle protein [Gemmatimonadaceae bacterium]|nr:four helix bundle protein [Gemmatimonadaceae bacterium]